MYEDRPYQTRAEAALRDAVKNGKRSIVLQAKCGCHAIGQLIMLHTGDRVPVEDVVVGDVLMGGDGTPRRVLSLCRGRGLMYRVVPKKGDSFVVNEDHVLTVHVLVRGTPAEQCSLVDVKLKDWLLWNNSLRFNSTLVRSGEVEFPLRRTHCNVFGDRWMPVDPYFLGALLGDGSLIRQIGLTTVDGVMKDEVYRQAAASGLRVREDVSSRTGVSTFFFAAKERGGRNGLRNLLRSIGVVGKDGSRKTIPDQYLFSDVPDRLQILAGLLDTDGYLDHGCYDYISQSQQLADGVVFLARSVGLAAYVRPCVKRCQTGGGGVYYRVSISGEVSRIPCRLDRKIADKRIINKNALRVGFSVDVIGEGEFFGFTLDGDGRYLMGDFTITHNSGKTVLASRLIKSAVAKGKKCMFLAPRIELIDQTVNKLRDFGIPHSLIVAEKKGLPDLTSPVLVCSKDTLVSRCFDHGRRRKKYDLPPADLVIPDEAHLSLAPQYRRLLEHYRGKSIVIGLTATPARPNGRGMDDFYDHMVITCSNDELLAGGWTVPYKCYAPYIPDLEDVDVGADGDYVVGQLEVKMNRPCLVGNIYQKWHNLGENRPTLVFASSVKHSLSIMEEFRAHGVAASHVDADTDPEVRAQILQNFTDGVIKVLVNVGIFIIGNDLPFVSCIVLARPTKSLVLFLQAIGRGSRPCPERGKTDCILIDHAGAVYNHCMPDEDIPWTLDHSTKIEGVVDREKKEGKIKKPVCCPVCTALFSGSNTCPICGHVLETRGRAVDTVDGDLVQVVRVAKKDVPWHEKLRYWQRCLAVAAARDQTFAMAACMFKGQYEQWPEDITPVLPSLPIPDNLPVEMQHMNQYRRRQLKVRQVFPNYSAEERKIKRMQQDESCSLFV